MDLFAGLGVAFAFVVGLLGHEYLTHLLAASRGDQAPRFQGRLTLDLRRHADQFGTWVLGIGFSGLVALETPMPFWFAFARPHAIAPAYQQRRGATRLVPLVGPVWSLAWFALIQHGLDPVMRADAIGSFGTYAALTFLYLSAVEILPIPGRDGGRVLATFLSPGAAMKMEELRQYEGLFIVGLFLVFPGAVSSVARILATLVGA